MDDKSDEFRENMNSLFRKHFLHRRRRRRCLSTLLSELFFFYDLSCCSHSTSTLFELPLTTHRDTFMEFFPKGTTRHTACCDLDQAFHDKNEA